MASSQQALEDEIAQAAKSAYGGYSSASYQQNLLSESDIDNEIIIVDGGDDGNPSIRPPDGL